MAAYLGGQEPPANKPPIYKSKEEQLPKAVARQPVLFSHKTHAISGSVCKDCHVTAGTKERAGLPQAELCMLCHRTVKTDSPEVKALARLHQSGEKIPWIRIYQVPEFVFFSHVNHGKAPVGCDTCHGPVAQRDVLAKEVSTTMTACMNCHAARGVSSDCHFCHSLGF